MWVLLSGSTVLKSEEYITATLNQNKDKILRGALYFKSNDMDREKELEQVTREWPDVEPETISRICDELSLSPKQAADLFLSFLSFEYTGSSKSIAHCFSCDKNLNLFLADLFAFHMEERLFSLFCLKEILSNWKFPDSKHPYQNMFATFIDSVGEAEIISLLMQQLEFLSQILTSGEMIYDSQTKWFEQYVRERVELIQLLILMYNQTDPTIDQVIRLLKVFDQMKFLTCRHNTPPDHCVSDMLEVAPLLESLLLVMVLNLKQMQESVNASGAIPLLADGIKAKQLDDLIRNRGVHQVTSAVLHLSWALVRSWPLQAFDAPESDAVVKSLGVAALNSDVFQMLANFLQSQFYETFIATSKVGTCIKTCIGSLVSVLFSIFSMDRMVGKKLPSLFKMMNHILNEDQVAEMALSDEDSGLFSAIQKAEMMLSKDPVPYLELAHAITSSSCSYQFVLNAMRLSSFVETLPSDSNLVVWSPGEGCFINRIDRLVYMHNSAIHVDRDAVGSVLTFNTEQETMDLVWNTVSFSVFIVMRDIYKSKLEFVSSGYYNYMTDEPTLQCVQLIHKVCQSVLTNTAIGKVPFEIKEVVRLSLDGIKLFARLPRFPRLFVSTALDLIAAFIDLNKKEAPAVWDLLQDVTLFPYVSGSTNDIDLLLTGNQVNSSEIGRRLVEDECTSSSYELCLSFLKLIHTLIDLIEPDERLLASITFVFTEVFPFYHMWHYKNNDETEIGYYCFSIAHKIVSRTTRPNKSISGRILKLTEVALLTGAGGESLLKTIKSGSLIVRRTIKNTGEDTSLWHKDVYKVRLALSVLQQLFKNKERIETTGDRNLSIVEKAFLTAYEMSAARQGSQKSEANMLIILTGYVNQSFDFRLTVLAVQTLKRLAKSFPMSMLACLGSEADAIKEHFLSRLESLTEDIRVKVALLDFLSACVQHQPGLMELFVTVESDAALPDDDSNSVLQVVLDTLKEKRDGRFYCPNELHVAAIRFLSTFWIKSNFLTITCLKKSPDLWSLICFPIFPDGDEGDPVINERLFSFILKLISREIFLKSIEREPLDKDLDSRLKKHLIARITQLSDHLRVSAMEAKIGRGSDSCLLLSAWRDLLTTLSIYETVPLESELRRTVFQNLLVCLLSQMKFRAERNVLSLIADSCLITFKKWSSDVLGEFDEWIDIMSQLIFLTNENRDELDTEFLITIQVLVIRSIDAFPPHDDNRVHHLVSWFPPAVGLLQHSMHSHFHVVSHEKEVTADAHKLIRVCLSLFNSLIRATSCKAVSWLHVIRSSSLIESMSQLLQGMIRLRKDPELPANLILLFIGFACIDPVADSLIASCRDDLLWVSSVMKSEPALNETISWKRGWDNVYILTIRLLTSLLATRSQFFVRDILQLITENLDRLTSCMRAFRTAPTREVIEEVAEVMKLIRLLSRFKNYWSSNCTLSFEVMVAECSMVACSATAFIVRPNFFSYMLQHPHSQKPLYRALLSRMNPSGGSNLPDETLTLIEKQATSCPPLPIDGETENQLNLILSLSTQILGQSLPALPEVLSMYQQSVRDPRKQLLKPLKLHLTSHFTTPSVEAEHASSFGSILQVVSMYVRRIRKKTAGSAASSESPKSTAGSGENSLPVSVMMTTIESGLCLLISQAFVAQIDPDVKASDKQFIIGELKSELHTILSPLSRPSKRSSSSVFPGASSLSSLPSGRSPSHSFSEYPLIKFLVADILEGME